MFEFTFATVFFTVMTILATAMLIGGIFFNKETKRMRKEYEDQKILNEKSAQS